MKTTVFDCIIIGGGQAGLSVAYFLNRKKISYLILDAAPTSGGSWLHTWESLTLFSPSQYSSLSGWQMPPTQAEYPSKPEFLNYLSNYEKRYKFPIQRNTSVQEVSKVDGLFRLVTNTEDYYSKTVVSATGTANSPFIPHYDNVENFTGIQLHSRDYKHPRSYQGKKVMVVGGGNSGAQILAEVSTVASTMWITLKPPVFLPEDIDGRYLFNTANNTYYNATNQLSKPSISLSDIVQVAPVREGLKRGVFQDFRPFTSFYTKGIVWKDGSKEPIDVVIWCTGFTPHLPHLQALNIVENNKVATNKTRSIKEPKLWLVGYGNWTGFASATIYGVAKTAKTTAAEIVEALK